MTPRLLRHRAAGAAVAALASVAVLGGCSLSPSVTAGTASARTADAERVVAAESEWSAVRVSVIGDSFSAGSMNDVVWPDVLAEEHGFEVTNASLGGAGYEAGDDYLGTFADQVAYATEENPTVILVVGSENDVDADPAEVLADATDLYASLRERSPEARIVVIGPIWSGEPVSEEMWDVDAAVSAAAVSAGLDYVDALPQEWLADPLIIQDDGDHPTDEGQYLLAGHIDDALMQLDPDLLG
ncbi:SGNH/GDSL hydrolase family protein [Rhodococcus sp. BP-349]|uniref:SGNH/GDSL hydrolase family protein n=1 Tax=unclassified Rhodococcus (in: high G+C Gram-positive bacteria) TaxID=192944 RepID=UPI001C9BA9D9|nr:MULTISPECIES: SGNH/GDSL hydrolase family protein [unclassified Rhodococcus (in: high G+C Gram-positive bacteria)]MBY6541157.1 SGNH/GDSL hydrolase family protein [Rhodococcus sp. BP-363]MBY6544817.1 SGNH/GDSL hydrolase family protein [Rhodococcus sp. BP-369]MBY6564047.1 SGNH/GDSL hydrolase family protein [Rhodococcus sp. BP-370]MBY6579016.1 SGNH/GDSL hydrolase family protein [Rhodococcus sp. BP-364]MBY6588317.1 SGNH/GDSL hydrolase family protein [Rhodococcus sp. BP-358]